MGLFGLFNRKPIVNKEEVTRDVKSGKGRFTASVNVRKFQAVVGLEEFNTARLMSMNPDNPSHEPLLGYFYEALRDGHLRSQIRSAIIKVAKEKWVIVDEGTTNIDKALTVRLQKKWFYDLIKLMLWQEFYGYQLIEFGLKDEKGDFKSVKQFPLYNVRPEDGRIFLDHSDAIGIPYRDYLKEFFFMELGTTYEDGLLSVCTKYALYVKYTLGDWSRSSEKWGDPIIALGTDSDNEGENNKKRDFLQNVGNNGWMMHDVDDKIAMLERKGSSPQEIYKQLIELNDARNSKLVNGQVATSDEKAFVGAAEVQERLFDDYTEDRLLNLGFNLNDQTKDFLIHHGYPLEGKEFMLEAYTKPKQELNTDTPATEEQKKKPNPQLIASPFLQLVDATYASSCNHNHSKGPELAYKNPLSLDGIVEKLIARLYERSSLEGKVDKALYRTQALSLWKGVLEGNKTNLANFNFMSNEHLLLMQLRHNVHVTAAFKVHQNIFEMSNALFDDQGNVVSKAAFLKKAEGISDKFNKNWSKTEYNHAVRASKSANQWLTFESRKKYLKNITWHAIKDENTRATHALLDGITLPVDHPFWDTHPVPYDWECRCYKTQNNDPIVEPPTDLPEPKAMFKNNPGKTGKAFLESHPYYSVDQNYANLAKRVFDVSLPISPSRLKENTQLYFKFMENKNYSLEYTDNLTGGFVTKHVDADAKDLRDNLRAAKILARENGDAIEIRQHIHKDGIKNPEFSINGVASDLKTPDRRKFKEVSTAIKNQFSRARKQDLNNLVIKVDGQYGLELIEEGVIEGFNRNEVIERVRIIYGGKAVEITRVEMEKGKVFDKLKDRL